jgi:hypothetical protein
MLLNCVRLWINDVHYYTSEVMNSFPNYIYLYKYVMEKITKLSKFIETETIQNKNKY